MYLINVMLSRANALYWGERKGSGCGLEKSGNKAAFLIRRCLPLPHP